MIALALALVSFLPSQATAAEQTCSPAGANIVEKICFPAVDNVTEILVQKIQAETVRVDISAWYLTEHWISIALINKYKSGVAVRLLGDRGSMFEVDPLTKKEFYWLASQGLPIRLRYNPTWYPEIDHWKMSIFVGQNLVSFGSANYTPFELAPASTSDFKDETVLFTDDTEIVHAFKTKFDRFWNDTTPEPESLVAGAPYFKNWYDACATEFTGNCRDFATLYPNPDPMIINTARLEPDYPTDLADMVWGQGPHFNDRLVQEINSETNGVDFVIYRLTVNNITQALLNKYQSGVPMRIIMEPNEYLNRRWPEFWLTHANMDKLWAAGVPIKKRIHNGLTHMKMLVTSRYATNASSNLAAAWQRDHDYFVPAATKPAVYQAMKNRFQTMWTSSGFADFVPQPPDSPTLVSPALNSSNVAADSSLIWSIAPFAVSYDVYLGTSQSNMTLVGNVPAQLVNSPPSTYSWTPPSALQPGTTYFWKVFSRTNATPVNPTLIGPSSTWSFTTAGAAGPPAAPTSPTPSDGATGVSSAPTLGWAPGGLGTSYNVAFGSTNPPPTVATGLSSSSYGPGILAANTTYYWRVTAVDSGGSTAGPIWSFTTATAGGPSATDVVIHAADVTNIHGTWTKVSDSSAAGGVKLSNPDNGVAALAAPLPNPTTNYFDVSFPAIGGTRYRVWLRIHAIGDSKWNDSVFAQFSDSIDNAGNPIYRIGTTTGLMVNLWTCTDCQSFGWGWQRSAYWMVDTGDVWFQNSGTHTLRVQIREDGSEIDQIVISPTTYATNAPGLISNDSTILQKSAQEPAAPGSPSPAAGATAVSTTAALTWAAAGATSYDVSFGTTNPPPLVVSGTSAASYTPSTLTNATTYFWQVVARNSAGATSGPVWSFTTVTAAPATPSTPSPADGATIAGTAVTLTWTAAGATSYDVLFGPSDPPSQVASGVTAASYTVSNLNPGAQYFWQIVARNSGGVNQGPEWTFTVPGALEPPAAPTSPNPAAGATGAATNLTLTWAAAGARSYDVLLGTTNPPLQVATGLTTASYAPSVLTNNTTYFWQVVARNTTGGTTGPVWSFTTAPPPPPPAMPSSPSPGEGAANVTLPPTLTWSSAGATTYDVMFGTANPPPQVAAGQTSASYTPASVAGSTTYFWEIVAHNSSGTTTGPVWSFTTKAPPPNGNIVVYASDATSIALHGGWTTASDPTSPNEIKLVTPDNGWASTGAPPSTLGDYIDVIFNANAGTPYTLWLRLQALARSKYNDAVWVQFSDALAGGSAAYPLNSTSALLVNLATDAAAGSLNGWGWSNSAYWLAQSPTITFATSGTHTLRIQVREDGVQLDQIVLSPTTYLNAAPGPATLDSAIVPKP
jgi:hypothetical protein